MSTANKIFTSVTTFNKDTDKCTLNLLGGYSDATERLHSVNVHDVDNITRTTRTRNGRKFTVITLSTPDGDIEITAHRAEA